MSAEHDATLAMAETKLSAASPAKAIPWDLVINAVLSLLKGCNPPTPAAAREQLANAGPFMRLQLTRKLMQGGMKFGDAKAATQASVKAAGESTDAEAEQFMAMAATADVAD